MTNEAERIAALLAEATPDAAAALHDIAETTADKETRKSARRALYRLSQAGIVPPEVERRVVAEPVRPHATESLRAYASAFDGAGNRLLFLVLPDPDGGSPTLLHILINDELGLKDLEVVRMSRRDLAAQIERFEGQLDSGLALAEIEADYGRWLLEQARQINVRLGEPTPPGFLALLPRIGAPDEADAEAPIYGQALAEEVRADPSLSRDPEALFALRWFEPWFFDVRDVVPWLESWEQAEQSLVVQPDAVKEERRQRVVTEAVQALMTPEMRARYVARLEGSADALWRRDRQEAARQALYHALSLADNGPVDHVPFARAIVQRTIEAAMDMVRAEEKRRREEAGVS